MAKQKAYIESYYCKREKFPDVAKRFYSIGDYLKKNSFNLINVGTSLFSGKEETPQEPSSPVAPIEEKTVPAAEEDPLESLKQKAQEEITDKILDIFK